MVRRQLIAAMCVMLVGCGCGSGEDGNCAQSDWTNLESRKELANMVDWSKLHRQLDESADCSDIFTINDAWKSSLGFKSGWECKNSWQESIDQCTLNISFSMSCTRSNHIDEGVHISFTGTILFDDSGHIVEGSVTAREVLPFGWTYPTGLNYCTSKIAI